MTKLYGISNGITVKVCHCYSFLKLIDWGEKSFNAVFLGRDTKDFS